MKLPDFKTFDPMNILKQQMGLQREQYGQYEGPDTIRLFANPPNDPKPDPDQDPSPIFKPILAKEIVTLIDNTIAYNGRRIVVYLRDREVYGDGFKDPRFHFADCKTLIKMKSANKFGKYIRNEDNSGFFELNIKRNGGSVSKIKKKLDVCKNCLELFSYDGFSFSQPQNDRNNAVANFSLSKFFDRFPQRYLSEYPKYDNFSAPVNIYPPEFTVISQHCREKAGWICQEVTCKVDISAPVNWKYLDTHHKNGEKYDNSTGNLIALCVFCHASTPMHARMRYSPRYKEFVPIRAKLLGKS